MNWKPQQRLSEQEVSKSMKVMIVDGLATETMTTLTGGAFLVAMALLSGANNVEIGLLAALPTATNVFQLISIWLCRRVPNRKVICVSLSILARLPLIAIGVLAMVMENFSFAVMLVFLSFHYFFGSVAGPVWNAWIKDIVPENKLGSYFARRGSYMQLLNVVLGISTAFYIDTVKVERADLQLYIYGAMFAIAGLAGIGGAVYMRKASEPQAVVSTGKIESLLRRPLADSNFRRLLTFNSVWVFAVNIASPFFTVFMMQTIKLSLSYIIVLTVVSQLSSIFTIRLWGSYADRYSNKNIIAIGGPLYIACLVGWCFVGLSNSMIVNMSLLFVIHALMGFANAGINLSLTNISLKLSPSSEAIIYLSARNIIVSAFSALAPLVGGILADYFSNRSLEANLKWSGPGTSKSIFLISLHQWNFLFIIGAFLALIALEMLVNVREKGEVEKAEVVKIMRGNIKNSLKESFVIGQIISWKERLWGRWRSADNKSLHA